jgi:SAM-dependent methyltransferase
MAATPDARLFYAETYDVCVGDWPGELEFYLNQIKTDNQSTLCSVLELACGTGLIAIRLARAGASVVGLDLYDQMLDVAREKSADLDNIRWIQGDMRSFELGEKFNRVIFPAHSFQNLNSPEDQADCLSVVFQHLEANGRLILHLDHQNFEWLAEVGGVKKGVFEPAEEFIHPISGNQVQTSRAWSFERASQTATIQTVWEEKDANGHVIQRVETGPIALHCIFHHEVVHLLARTGFEVEHVYGDFFAHDLDNESEQMVWIAKKPEDERE